MRASRRPFRISKLDVTLHVMHSVCDTIPYHHTVGETGGLGSTAKEYTERCVQEVLGASVALDAAIEAMVARK